MSSNQDKQNGKNEENVLIMISTHGTWKTTDETKIDDMKKLFDSACDKIYNKLNNDDTQYNNIYIGYDGDGIYNAPPPTLLLLMLIRKFISNKNLPLLAQSQCSAYIESFNKIKSLFKNDKVSVLLPGLSEDEISKIQSVLTREENINIQHSLYGKECEKSPTLKDNDKTLMYNVNTGPGMYGGYKNGKLYASTDGWDKFLSDETNPIKFSKVFYLPVWDDELVIGDKKYDGTITAQIVSAVNDNVFSSNNIVVL